MNKIVTKVLSFLAVVSFLGFGHCNGMKDYNTGKENTKDSTEKSSLDLLEIQDELGKLMIDLLYDTKIIGSYLGHYLSENSVEKISEKLQSISLKYWVIRYEPIEVMANIVALFYLMNYILNEFQGKLPDHAIRIKKNTEVNSNVIEQDIVLRFNTDSEFTKDKGGKKSQFTINSNHGKYTLTVEGMLPDKEKSSTPSLYCKNIRISFNLNGRLFEILNI